MSKVGYGLIYLFMQSVKLSSAVRGSLAPPLW